MGSRRSTRKEKEDTKGQQEKKESRKPQKKVKLVLEYCPDYGILHLMGYTFIRGVPTEVAAGEVEELKKRNGFLKEV